MNTNFSIITTKANMRKDFERMKHEHFMKRHDVLFSKFDNLAGQFVINDSAQLCWQRSKEDVRLVTIATAYSMCVFLKRPVPARNILDIYFDNDGLLKKEYNGTL